MQSNESLISPPGPVFRAAQYVRMSTEHQQYSTENQADKIKEYAARRGIDVVIGIVETHGRAETEELVAGLEREEQQRRERARMLFTQFMNEKAVQIGPVDPASKGVTASWYENTTMQASEVVGSYGRVFDVVCVGRPRKDDAALSLAFVEAALFESGRPVLLAPPEPPATIGSVVVIAWNASTETARTLALGMPLVGEVKKAIVLTIRGGSINGPPGEDAARNLRCHGIDAAAVEVDAGGLSVGEAILAHCKEVGADLLIKGAYTQSRLKQMIFGGATQHILTSAELPVIMAH